jgi:hypothetical protein
MNSEALNKLKSFKEKRERKAIESGSSMGE